MLQGGMRVDERRLRHVERPYLKRMMIIFIDLLIKILCGVIVNLVVHCLHWIILVPYVSSRT
jgi:hypothetical protein